MNSTWAERLSIHVTIQENHTDGDGHALERRVFAIDEPNWAVPAPRSSPRWAQV
jgi:hypothetical protein